VRGDAGRLLVPHYRNIDDRLKTKAVKMALLEETIAKEMRDIFAAAFKDHTAPLFKRIEELSAQVAELQSAGIRYVGGYQRAQTYKRGDICTQDGSMWCAVNDVGPNEQPGRCDSWQLCCRAGRDGKDANSAAR